MSKRPPKQGAFLKEVQAGGRAIPEGSRKFAWKEAIVPPAAQAPGALAGAKPPKFNDHSETLAPAPGSRTPRNLKGQPDLARMRRALERAGRKGK